MKFLLSLLFTALLFAVNAVPAKKSFSVANAKGFGAKLVGVPLAVGTGCQQNRTPTSTRSKSPFPSTITTFTPQTTPASASDNTPPASGGPPVGIGGCVSCSVDNFNLVNEYRASRGLSRLSWSNTLANLAEGWSKRMFDTRVIEHSDFPYWENIAWTYNRHTWSTAANGFFEGWRNSPDQDENMRLSSHVCMGVGIYGDGKLLDATQIFSNHCP